MNPTIMVLSACLALWLARALLVQVRGTELVRLRWFHRRAAAARRHGTTTWATVESTRRITLGWSHLLRATLAERTTRWSKRAADLRVLVAKLAEDAATMARAVEAAAAVCAEKWRVAQELPKPLRWLIAAPILVGVGVAEIVGLIVVLEGLDIDPTKARLMALGGAMALLWLPEHLGAVHHLRAEQQATGKVLVPWSRAMARVSRLAVLGVIALVVAIVVGRSFDLDQAATASGLTIPLPTLVVVTLGLALAPVVTSTVLGAATSSHAHRAYRDARAAWRRARLAHWWSERRLTRARRELARVDSLVASHTAVMEHRIAALDDLQAGVLLSGASGPAVTVDGFDAVEGHLPGWSADAEVIHLRPVADPDDGPDSAEA